MDKGRWQLEHQNTCKELSDSCSFSLKVSGNLQAFLRQPWSWKQMKDLPDSRPAFYGSLYDWTVLSVRAVKERERDPERLQDSKPSISRFCPVILVTLLSIHVLYSLTFPSSRYIGNTAGGVTGVPNKYCPRGSSHLPFDELHLVPATLLWTRLSILHN